MVPFHPCFAQVVSAPRSFSSTSDSCVGRSKDIPVVGSHPTCSRCVNFGTSAPTGSHNLEKKGIAQFLGCVWVVVVYNPDWVTFTNTCTLIIDGIQTHTHTHTHTIIRPDIGVSHRLLAPPTVVQPKPLQNGMGQKKDKHTEYLPTEVKRKIAAVGRKCISPWQMRYP